MMTVATSAAKEMGMTDNEIDKYKSDITSAGRYNVMLDADNDSPRLHVAHPLRGSLLTNPNRLHRRTLSAELRRVATTPAAIPESGRVGAKSDTLELPESLHSISEYESRPEGTLSHGTAPLVADTREAATCSGLLACMFGIFLVPWLVYYARKRGLPVSCGDTGRGG
jgi:hypothetical protein